MGKDTNTLSLSDVEFEKLPNPSQEMPSEASAEAQEELSEIGVDEDISEENKSTEEPVNESETNEAEETNQTSEESTNVLTEEVDYKKVYEEVFKPFKANGKEMKVDNIDDVRQLMQMGANYNKKMAAIKPNLKVIKMLENNGLLDEAKLSYLIDLDKKNPEAIKKLIKDSGIDPLEVDIHKEVEYKANTYNVNDKELELDSVLSEIRETDSFNTTVDIIGNKWDERSKEVLVNNPSIIKIINDHVSSGVYSKITGEIDRLRVLGKLEGLSDIEAYKAVGDSMYATKPNVANAQNTSTSKATNKEDPQLKDRKKAASTTKGVVSNNKPDYNPLSMSDDEFEKIASSKFI